MFVPANQINRSGLFCSESERSQSKAERWFTWLLCMLTPTWHYVAGDMRLPQVAASPPPRDLPSILWKNVRCTLWKTNREQKKGHKQLEEKKPNRRRGRKHPGSRNKRVRYTDTKPAQLSKHSSGSSPPVWDVVAEIWVCRAGSESRNPGFTQESCRAIASSVRAWCPLLNTPVSLSVQLCFTAVYF